MVLRGGVHGAGIYVVNDPVFGTICYGGDLTVEDNAYRIRSYDGAGRYLAIPEAGGFEMRLYNNGMDDSRDLIVAKDLDRMVLNLEKRGTCDSQKISFRNLPAGEYGMSVDGRNAGSFRVNAGWTDVNVGCGLDRFKLEIKKIN